MKSYLVHVGVISFLLLGVASASGMDCEIPPFINQVTIPNVLIILDNSGSMKTQDVPGYEDRWECAKAVLMQFLSEAEGLRFGLMRMDGSDRTGWRSHYSWQNPSGTWFNTGSSFVRHGGKLLRPIGTPAAEIIDYIDGMEVYDTIPHTYTVNGETLFTAAQYFAGGHGHPNLGTYKGDSQTNYKYYKGSKQYWASQTDDYGNTIDTSSPIQHWCQKNFVIYVTDGESNCDSDWDRLINLVGDYDGDGADDPNVDEWDETGGHHYIDDVAKAMYENDLRLDDGMPGIQNVITYVIGFKINAPLLQRAADENHGRGKYITADNYDQLKAAFDDVLTDIIQRTASGTAVAILSTSSSSENKLFRAKFHPTQWRGFLEAFSLPYNNGDDPLWDAGYKLKDNIQPGNRKIYTAFDSEAGAGSRMDNKVEFIPDNINVQDANGVKLKNHLGINDNNNARGLIRFMRGEDFPPDTRTRGGFKLGDIIFSTPVVSGNTVYAGANDGMLHAFDVNTGMERWAFIPNNLLGKLVDYCLPDYCHEYYVDLRCVVADVHIGGVSKKVLICGERAGGKAYFCLDITDSSAAGFQPMWEFTNDDLGESWSVPDIKPKKINGQTKWLAFFGSGFENDDHDESDRHYKGWGFAVDIETGDIIRMGGIDDHGNKNFPNAITAPRTIDVDGDQCVDIAYVGSVQERLIRVDLTPLPDDWRKKHIFTTRPRQPITIPTSLCYYDNDPTHVMVFFGTGKFYDLEDKTDFTVQSFYAVKDEGGQNAVGIGQLVDQTSACNSVPGPGNSTMGWYIDFSAHPGERVVSSALVIGGYVFFTTFQPSDDPCEAGGMARLWTTKYDTGCAPDSPIVDINGDGVVDQADKVGGCVPRCIEIGYGIPSDIVYNASESTIIIQTSDTTIHQFKINVGDKKITVHSWREVID